MHKQIAAAATSSRSNMALNVSRIDNPHSQENEFESSSTFSLLPPSRAPLNSIPDPSQLQKLHHASDLDSVHKGDTTRRQHHQRTPRHEKRTDVLEGRAGNASSMYHSTPRKVGRSGKANSEPNSAHSTPARSAARVSLGGGARSVQCFGGRETTSSSRVSRKIPVDDSFFSVEVPHFELNEDPLFWQDHNVQVLIRIRPLNTHETVSQGYSRCLKQESPHTLVWLGHPESRFTFDNVACETISQEKLFRVAGLPMVENCMSGYNSCMFAYGQTGSGKTYTMMGEISGAETGFSEDCGVTPRIFDHLFSRIKMEEESRRDEKLKFSCKCSFVEIYNEQITDLLEPSSTNLQLREDLAKGVYVENLTEYNVGNVNDVLKLLLQGAANRKMAATHMNSESSRSHSVFMCVIESRWERDSLTHFRFARLNLVDLAGSERQKSSGAEGDRLKEAANINKSLSTLGMVIMSLVDLAQGKHRHVPYRDSRLTFLLQDSLGGNSKTMIIANVSPSLCSASETLSTLKFAQRAKLIQNNAKVNEDASGDITALKREIKKLKGQLSSLVKNQNSSVVVPDCIASVGESRYSSTCKVSGEIVQDDCHGLVQSTQSMKVEDMKAILVGALRREKLAEAALQKSESEIEHLNGLVTQKEEDAQRTKMTLRFREDKIKQLEMLISGSLSVQEYLVEENKNLKEELQHLQARIDRNPELTRFALENIRLLEQLQMYDNFYEQGERETLLAEISELRDQLLDVLEAKDESFSRYALKANDVEKELEDCRNMNSSLIRELDQIRAGLGRYLNCNQTDYDVHTSLPKEPEQFIRGDNQSLVETMSTRSDSGDDMLFYAQEDNFLENKNCGDMGGVSGNHHDEIRKELMDARFLIEAMEAEKVRLINELQAMQKQNDRYKEILSKKDDVERDILPKPEDHDIGLTGLDLKNKAAVTETSGGIDRHVLQLKLEKLSKDLEEARILNSEYEKVQTLQLSQQRDIELVCEQVESETARTVLHLQEEVIALQSEFQESMSNMTEENKLLKDAITAKEAEIMALTREWEKATLELTSFILDGSKSIKDASAQVESIVCLFPHVSSHIGDYVEKATRVCIEKEETVLLLQKSLEDAQKLLTEMDLKLNSLKGATIALSEFQMQESGASAEEALHLSTEANRTSNEVHIAESKVKSTQHQILQAERRVEAALVVVKWLSDSVHVSGSVDIDSNTCTTNLSAPINYIHKLSNQRPDDNILMDDDTNARAEIANYGVMECESDIHALLADIQVHLAASRTDFLRMYSDCMDLVHDVIREVQVIRHEFPGLKRNHVDNQYQTIESQSADPCKAWMIQNQHQRPHKENDHCSGRSGAVSSVFDSSNVKGHMLIVPSKDGYLSDEAYGRGAESGDQEMQKDRIEAVSLTLNNESDSVHSIHCEEGKQSAMPLESAEMESECSSASSSEVYVSPIQRMKPAGSLFKKFEETHAAMMEADCALRQLVNANEESKHVAQMWREAGEELAVERLSLMEDIEQLRSSASLCEQENQMLLSQLHYVVADMTNSVSLLEENFQQMKRGVEETLQVLHTDALLVRGEMLHFIANSRLLLEEMFSENIERWFTLYVIYQCHIGKHMEQILDQDKEHVTPHMILQEKRQPMESNTVGSSPKDEGSGEVNGFNRSDRVTNSENEVAHPHNSLIYENLSLKMELERKESLFEGLLFDFRLLQESASNKQDIKDETVNLIDALHQVRQELELKTSHVDELLVQQTKLENCLDDMQKALFKSNSDLKQARERVDMLTEQNEGFRDLTKDLNLKKAVAEEGLEEQKELIKGLEKEIVNLSTTAEKQLLSSVKAIEEDLRKVSDEKDRLAEEICSLNDKLEMAYTLADEKEAIAVEARQECEASKIYAEQKEEEVRILEISVEELESTVNVLEKRVYDMDEELQRHRVIRNSLEAEIQDLTQRLLKVEDFTKVVTTNVCTEGYEGQASRSKQLQEAHYQIQVLEKEIAELNKEIKQLNEYVSEILLHSEAQASGYQEKYKALEAMVRDCKVDVSNSSTAAAVSHKTEKSSARTRGSGSPFRCIAGLVQQTNLEKDQELTMARLRIEELESLLTAKHKEVCSLNTRVAASECMTHDVIRDLIGVKMDITNYADIIERYQIQGLIEDAHQHAKEISSKEHEIMNLKRRIDALIEERDSCISDVNKKEADILAVQINLEQLQERDHLLSAQNEMLKMDKSNLLRRIAELDQTTRTNGDSQYVQPQTRRESMPVRLIDTEYSKRLEQAQKLLTHANDELTKYRRTSGNHPSVRTHGQSSGSRRSRQTS